MTKAFIKKLETICGKIETLQHAAHNHYDIQEALGEAKRYALVALRQAERSAS